MSIADFIYYTVLKSGKIIMIVLGFFLFILVFMYTGRFGVGVSDVTSASLKECVEDTDCFFYCGDCYSIKPLRYCEDEGIETLDCVCSNNLCRIA